MRRRGGVKNNNGKLILLVEDNEQIMDGNSRMLERHGYETISALTLEGARAATFADARAATFADARAVTLEGARAATRGRRPDVIVLDIMLPDGNGLDFIRELREVEKIGVPVLLLTGLATKEDILLGLKSGGDDYLAKPYDFDELLARVEALLRRSERVPEVITKGRLSLDVTAGVASMDGLDLLLTQKEFALLLVFVQNEGRFVDGVYLYEKVWKAPMAGNSGAVRKTVSALRGKIKGSGWAITWTKGKGYLFGR